MIKHFTENLLGKDYVVGDIHGCFRKLERELAEIGFDETKDRLFAVGDLVDRGPDSEEALDWLAKSWFNSVRGNHEQMAIDFIDGNSDRYMYAYNGGQWFLDICDADERLGRMYAQVFRELPIAIDITVGNKVYGIIHADCPGGDWSKLEQGFSGVQSQDYENLAMWSRDRINGMDKSFVQNAELVYVGHTPLREIKVLGNVIYVDQGACFGGELTLLEIY
jgi:serine/threonine protein phosphatase 1